MINKRLIAVFSGNRAEYGLQFPILRAIRDHPKLDYRLIISGAHLDSNYGKTKSEIHDDGFDIFYGFGIKIAISEQFAAVAEYENYKFDEEDVQLFTAGIQIIF